MFLQQNESSAQVVKDDDPSQGDTSTSSSSLFDWRTHLASHPAADLLPSLSDAEQGVLTDDTHANLKRGQS
jgi:hypothetical protein